MSIDQMLQQLKGQHVAITNAIASLERYHVSTKGSPTNLSQGGWPCGRCGAQNNIGKICAACGRSCRGRKSMSPAERKRVSERMRSYWNSRRKTV